MLTYTTTQRRKKLLTAVVLSVFAMGLIVYSVPVFSKIYGFPFVLAAVILFVAGLFLFIRYSMTAFTYRIRVSSDMDCDPDSVLESYQDISSVPAEYLDLIVYKVQGAREGAMECVLSVSGLKDAYEIRKGALSRNDVAKKYAGRAFTFYDYTSTFLPRKVYEFVFEDGERPVGIILEDANPVSDYLISMAGK